MHKALLTIVFAAGLAACTADTTVQPMVERANNGQILFATDHLWFIVGPDGRINAFADTQTHTSHLNADDPAPFMSIQFDGVRKHGSYGGPPEAGRWVDATGVEWHRGFLHVTFGETGVRAKVHVRAFANYLTFELTAVNDHSITSIRLARLPLTLTQYVGSSLVNCRDDEFAAAVVALNVETNAMLDQRDPPVLVGHADHEVRLDGAKIAVVGCPTPKLLDILEQIEIENGLPHMTLDGVWAKRSPLVMRSQLFTDISEATADEVIALAKAGGFGYIVLYRSTWCSSQGSYLINRRSFPGGEAGLQAVSEKIHAAGLKFGLHNLELIIAKHDPLLHPMPADGFMMLDARRRILAADIGPDDKFIPTTTSPRGLLAKGDKSIYHGRDLRIGDEVIVYDALQTEPPYGFAGDSDSDTYSPWHGNYRGCIRGAYGTKASAHKAGAVIDNFFEFINGYFRPRAGTALFDRVTRNMADVLEKYQVDYLYPDGHGQNIGYDAEGPQWYVRKLSMHKLQAHTNREVRYIWGDWHISSQGGDITDSVQNGVFETFNSCLRSTKIAEANLQPFDFGWLGYYQHLPQGPATRPRQMEYAWAKALAYGAAIALNTNQDAMNRNGRTGEIFALMKRWEQLKLDGYFPQSIREQMKAPGSEFTLRRTGEDQWQVLPITYNPDQYIAAVDGKQNVWAFDSSHRPQPLRVFIEPMPQLGEYGDASNIVLLKPGPVTMRTTGTGPMWQARQTQGFEYALRPDDEDAPDEAQSFFVTASNQGTTEKGWGCGEVVLDAAKDLTNHRALGTWVKGDGSGAYLHFVLEADPWRARDYYVHLDFTGWKYVIMPESAGDEIYEFAFPFSTFTALGLMDFAKVNKIYVFITNLAPGESAEASFGRLEALRETPLAVHNPAVAVDGRSITFPVTLQPDWYLEYHGGGHARVYDPNGFVQAEVAPTGAIPVLRKGANEATFFCERGPQNGQAAKVTVITRGAPLAEPH